jgi:hypothetical protein
MKKKLFVLTLVSSSLFLGANPVKADWDTWGFKDAYDTVNGVSDWFNDLYTINSFTGEETFRQRFATTNNIPQHSLFPYAPYPADILNNHNHVNKDSFVIRERNFFNNNWMLKKYTLSGDTLSSEEVTSQGDTWTDNYSYFTTRGSEGIDADGNFYSDVGGQLWIKQDSSGTISFGKTGSTTPFYSLSEDGVLQNGANLISRSSDGITSIGANSLKLQESNGFQKMWATNASGDSIPIDITNGSKLLINGRDVEQSINNVGALSAALTGLPTVPSDTTLACGLGTGTHGGDFAFSGGCASKVNDKLSINYAASMTMPGQDYAGKFEDKFSARAGFVWKLGKSNDPTKISLNESKELKKEVQDLKSKNDAIISQNAKLLARLEKLENIALNLQKNEELQLSKGL